MVNRKNAVKDGIRVLEAPMPTIAELAEAAASKPSNRTPKPQRVKRPTMTTHAHHAVPVSAPVDAAPAQVQDAPAAKPMPKPRTWQQFMNRTLTGRIITHTGAALAGAAVGIVVGRATVGKSATVSVETPDNVVDINVAAAE